jgi:hypothetical protein
MLATTSHSSANRRNFSEALIGLSSLIFLMSFELYQRLRFVCHSDPAALSLLVFAKALASGLLAEACL